MKQPLVKFLCHGPFVLRPNDVTLCALISSCSRASQWQSQPQLQLLRPVTFLPFCTSHLCVYRVYHFCFTIYRVVWYCWIVEKSRDWSDCALWKGWLSPCSSPIRRSLGWRSPNFERWELNFDCPDERCLCIAPVKITPQCWSCLHVHSKLEALDIPVCISMEKAWM